MTETDFTPAAPAGSPAAFGVEEHLPASAQVIPVAVARPVAPLAPMYSACVGGLPVPVRTDTLAIASAVCGLTAIVPVLSQGAGLALGIASLVRISRARRCGIAVGGRGWALTGIISSAFMLLSWIAVFGFLCAAGASLASTTDALQAISPAQ